jgi:predicted transcriptional regulator
MALRVGTRGVQRTDGFVPGVRGGAAPVDESRFEHLSTRQRQIVEAVAALGRATINDITRTIPDPPTANAVRTMVGHLVEAGVLTRSREGRAGVYSLRRSRSAVARRALKRLLAMFFGGSLERAVALHLSGASTDIDEAELKRIERLVREARREREGG